MSEIHVCVWQSETRFALGALLFTAGTYVKCFAKINLFKKLPVTNDSELLLLVCFLFWFPGNYEETGQIKDVKKTSRRPTSRSDSTTRRATCRPQSSKITAPLQPDELSSQAKSHEGMKLNLWKVEDMMAALRKYHTAAETKPSMRQLARTWNIPVATLFKKYEVEGQIMSISQAGTLF